MSDSVIVNIEGWLDQARGGSKEALGRLLAAHMNYLKTLAYAQMDDRYATARELADDLSRFLNHQPIAARRPSAIDRLGKWALRKKK
jgi:hypothetical protein